MAESWRRLVCGFLSEGPAPPETCPVCGADSPQSALVGRGKTRLLRDLFDTFLPHAVVAHIPNGVLPAAALFLLLGLATGSQALETTAFHLLLLAVLAVPASFLTGVYDWKHRYHGLRVPVFYRKTALAAALLLLGVAALALRFVQPDLPVRGGMPLALYAGLLFGMLATAVFLGHYGGKLVFYWKKR